MRWSSALTWLALPFFYPQHLTCFANGNNGVPSSNQPGSKARTGNPAASGGNGAPPKHKMKEIPSETLLLRPLLDGKVAAHFEFDYLSRDSVPRDPATLGVEDEDQHYEVFPMPLGQILRQYAVAELHLTLNTGRWRYDVWGAPSNPAVASGAELWVWMADGGPVSVEDRWTGLTNSLAGLFCASLSSLAQSRSTTPHHSFHPEGQLPLYRSVNQTTADKVIPGYSLHHAILPSEAICTENLTPFMKLLPCKSYAGLAQLLNSHKLFGGYWYGMGVHASWRDGESIDLSKGTEMAVTGMGSKARPGKYNPEAVYGKDGSVVEKESRGVKLQLTVGAVLDPLGGRQHWARKDETAWTLESLLGRNITKFCPVTTKADVRISPSDRETMGLVLDPSPAATYKLGKESWDVVRVGGGGLNLTVSQKMMPSNGAVPRKLTPLVITRSLRGSDQTRGGLSITITNHAETPIDAWYVETIPWIVLPYLSTLRVNSVLSLDTTDSSSQPNSPQQTTLDVHNVSPSKVLNIRNIHYVPPSSASEKKKPTLLEIPLHLPARSMVHLSLDFEKVFLKYTEHPPDAMRGWEIPGGVLVPIAKDATDLSDKGETEYPTLARMYTAPLLADLATPDFSMPYNVIILSGALVALLFGMMFNMLTRRFVLVKT